MRYMDNRVNIKIGLRTKLSPKYQNYVYFVIIDFLTGLYNFIIIIVFSFRYKSCQTYKYKYL